MTSGNFCLFIFLFLVFPWVLWRSWAKVAKTSRKQKKTTHGEGLRRSWTGDMGLFFSMVLDPFFPLLEFGLFV